MNNQLNGNGRNLVNELIHRYFPYWPAFAALLIASLLTAYVYLQYTSPKYEATAALIIKDENKGVDDPRMTEAINMFTSKKIVENELEVIHSRGLMKKVVEELNLYVPIYEERKIKSVPAYLSSPVTIKHKSPYNLKVSSPNSSEIYFSYDSIAGKVRLEGELYPLNEWVKTSYGELQFTLNPKQQQTAKGDLYFKLMHPQLIADALLKDLEVSPASKLSTVVVLKIKDTVPQRGEDILNQLIHAYNQAAIVDRNALALNTMKFIEDRIKHIEEELGELESQVQAYKSKRGIVDLSEQGRVYLQSVGENARKTEEINIQLTVLDKVEKYVASKDKSASIVPATLGVNDPVLAQLLQKLYDSETQYQKLRKTTAENNPILASISDEIQKIRPSIIENIRNQRDNLLAARAKLMSTKDQYSSALQTIPESERELLEISRQQAIKNSVYSFLLQKREETALSYAPTASDMKVVDMAESSVWPVSPNAKIVYLIAVAVAFFIGIAFTTGKEIISSKILYRSEIESCIGAPVVAELSSVKQKGGSLFEQPEAFTVEQFRQMRTTLGLYGRSFSKKKILVTSSIPGEGKSFVSTNLALSLSLSGRKVAMVDMDLRNPNTTNLFNLFGEEGVTEFMSGELDAQRVTKSTDFKDLAIVPAGAKIGDNTEVLLNGKLEELFSYLEAEFDYLVIDSPPTDLVSDAYLLSEFCDITLFVIRHAYTPKAIVHNLNQSSKTKSLKNLAIVFNGIKSRGLVKSYGYGYGYGREHVYREKYLKRRV